MGRSVAPWIAFLWPKPVSVAINLKQDGSTASVTSPTGGSSVALALKAAMDFAIALSVILFVSPLLFVVAVLIKLDSKGPVLFRQRRTGLNGRVITVLKFRTMHVLEDGETIRHASRKDSRVTRVGSFLRRSSIDELPQLFNVLKGNMSIVGPRPHALAHDAHYSAALPNYDLRFRMKPGITGLAQVSGMRGEILSIGSMADRVDADNLYIDTWSLGSDLKIMLKTAVVVAFQDAAY
jgi:putative colanic acid biosynthesis UDP-glucose lipid carrier transferase